MAKNNISTYSTVQRWLNNVSGSGISSSQTVKLYLHFLKRYCDFLKMTPDAIIADRRRDLKSDDELTQRKHEEKIINFQKFLEPQLSRSSIGTAQRVIKSFYAANYSDLKVNPPKTWAATQRSVPRPNELRDMIDHCGSYRDKALIMFLAQTGMSIGDVPCVTFSLLKAQLRNEMSPIHMHILREKTKTEYDTFIGHDAITFLRLYLAENPPDSDDSPLFTISDRTIETIVKTASIKAGIHPHVTPHRLRSFFKTYLTLDGVPKEIVEYWMGHRVAYGGAYLVPPVDTAEGLPSQRQLYKDHEKVLSIGV